MAISDILLLVSWPLGAALGLQLVLAFPVYFFGGQKLVDKKERKHGVGCMPRDNRFLRLPFIIGTIVGIMLLVSELAPKSNSLDTTMGGIAIASVLAFLIYIIVRIARTNWKSKTSRRKLFYSLSVATSSIGWVAFLVAIVIGFIIIILFAKGFLSGSGSGSSRSGGDEDDDAPYIDHHNKILDGTTVLADGHYTKLRSRGDGNYDGDDGHVYRLGSQGDPVRVY